MTTYTTYGLPKYDTTDLIAASADNLRTKINAVSTTANTALTGVEGRSLAKAPTELGVQDANTLTTTGRYHQSSNADAANSGNYPANSAGMFEVDDAGGGFIYQQYRTYNSPNGNAIYNRAYYGGNWSPWKKTATAAEVSAEYATTESLNGRLLSNAPVEGHDFAVVDSEDRIVFTPPRTHPVLDWAHWGDSLTDDLITGDESWTVQLAGLTGRRHYNGGWYQQKAAHIAARQGGLPPIVTLVGNTTAAGTGGTEVETVINSPVLTDSRYVRGTLAGIPGAMRNATGQPVMFYPDVPGVYPVPARSIFTPEDALALRDRHVTIWAGRNDIYTTDPDYVVSSVQSMVEYLNTDVKRIIVMEVPPSTEDSAATRADTAIMNDKLKAAFSPYWLNIATFLRTEEAATAAGITFTAQDYTDIENGNTPSSFRMDSIHLNGAGCTAVAYRVHQEAQNRGWL